MKKIGEYTCTGMVGDGQFERILLFDGRFDTGYRVTQFQLFPTAPFLGNGDVYGTLALQTDVTGYQYWRADDNRQIGWSCFSSTGTDDITSSFSVLEPDNLIIEDLYLYANEEGNDNCNYFIKLDKYDISEWRGALAMVRNRSQT
mgnify:FL=1